jgi:hypothetical protein
VWKLEGRRPLEISRRRLESGLTQDRDRRRALASMVRNLGVP